MLDRLSDALELSLTLSQASCAASKLSDLRAKCETHHNETNNTAQMLSNDEKTSLCELADFVRRQTRIDRKLLAQLPISSAKTISSTNKNMMHTRIDDSSEHGDYLQHLTDAQKNRFTNLLDDLSELPPYEDIPPDDIEELLFYIQLVQATI